MNASTVVRSGYSIRSLLSIASACAQRHGIAVGPLDSYKHTWQPDTLTLMTLSLFWEPNHNIPVQIRSLRGNARHHGGGLKAPGTAVLQARGILPVLRSTGCRMPKLVTIAQE